MRLIFTLSVLALVAVIIAFDVIGTWMLFKKAGRPGWESLIPIYRDYISHELYWGNGWLFLIPTVLTCLAKIPQWGALFSLLWVVFRFITIRKMARAFGYYGLGFAIILYIFPFIVSIIMGISENHPYMGVPKDGSSYEEIKAKFGK